MERRNTANIEDVERDLCPANREYGPGGSARIHEAAGEDGVRSEQ
jgi:hypothetical protein